MSVGVLLAVLSSVAVASPPEWPVQVKYDRFTGVTTVSVRADLDAKHSEVLVFAVFDPFVGRTRPKHRAPEPLHCQVIDVHRGAWRYGEYRVVYLLVDGQGYRIQGESWRTHVIEGDRVMEGLSFDVDKPDLGVLAKARKIEIRVGVDTEAVIPVGVFSALHRWWEKPTGAGAR